jgi:hypothetical protein
MKDINHRAMELNRLRQVLEVVPYEPMALLNDTQRQFIREMAVHLGLEGEKLIQQVEDYIDGILQAEEAPLKAEKVLSVVSSKLKELEDDVEEERQRNVARNKDNVSQPAAGTSKEAAEPQQEGGASSEDSNAPPLELRGSARLHGGLKVAMEVYRRRLDVAVDLANHVNLEDLESCLEASEKLTAAYVDLQAQCAGKADAEGEGDAWQRDFAAWTVNVRPAKERMAAAIKLLQARQRKHMYQAASRAVDRALAAANDALGDNDPDEIEEVRQQLSAKLREMEVAAAYLDDDPLLQDGEKLQEAEKSLRKLGKKKTELLQTDVGNSPTFKVPPWWQQAPVAPAAPPAAATAAPSTVQ